MDLQITLGSTFSDIGNTGFTANFYAKLQNYFVNISGRNFFEGGEAIVSVGEDDALEVSNMFLKVFFDSFTTSSFFLVFFVFLSYW
ncbi:MAG: hypothetical protein F6J86_04495 [Symploca sp. SIO1B1]|nr:hypothetical protein [Symploca sp. SIO1B1]